MQTNDIIAVASAVLDGNIDGEDDIEKPMFTLCSSTFADTPGPYNKEGSLFASFQSNGGLSCNFSGSLIRRVPLVT